MPKQRDSRSPIDAMEPWEQRHWNESTSERAFGPNSRPASLYPFPYQNPATRDRDFHPYSPTPNNGHESIEPPIQGRFLTQQNDRQRLMAVPRRQSLASSDSARPVHRAGSGSMTGSEFSADSRTLSGRRATTSTDRSGEPFSPLQATNGIDTYVTGNPSGRSSSVKRKHIPAWVEQNGHERVQRVPPADVRDGRGEKGRFREGLYERTQTGQYGWQVPVSPVSPTLDRAPQPTTMMVTQTPADMPQTEAAMASRRARPNRVKPPRYA